MSSIRGRQGHDHSLGEPNHMAIWLIHVIELITHVTPLPLSPNQSLPERVLSSCWPVSKIRAKSGHIG